MTGVPKANDLDIGREHLDQYEDNRFRNDLGYHQANDTKEVAQNDKQYYVNQWRTNILNVKRFLFFMCDKKHRR